MPRVVLADFEREHGHAMFESGGGCDLNLVLYVPRKREAKLTVRDYEWVGMSFVNGEGMLAVAIVDPSRSDESKSGEGRALGYEAYVKSFQDAAGYLGGTSTNLRDCLYRNFTSTPIHCMLLGGARTAMKRQSRPK